MIQDTTLTKMTFRKFKNGDIIALFPEQIADFNGNIMSYMRVGQHGAASPALIKDLKPAKPSELKPLLNELVNHFGYKPLLTA